MSNTVFKKEFIESLSPVPEHVNNNINFEFSNKYFLVNLGKVIRKANIEIGTSIIIKRGDTASYPTKLWNGLFAADYNSLYLKYSRHKFQLIIGRVPIRWSISPFSSMIFTGYEPGLDLFYYSLDYSRVKGDYFFSILRDNEHYRYLAAHRFIFNVIRNFQFSFGDIILYQTPDGLPDFYYFNPLAIYYVRQWTLDSSGMTNSAFDFKGEYTYKNFHLYGELFIDDFPYIKVYHENPRMGGLLGIIYKKRNTRFVLEYRRLNRFTYCYYAFAPYLSFKFFNEPLGDIEGNDFDILTIMYAVKTENVVAGTTLKYKRHGKGNIFEGYRSTSEESEEYFLSGIVEKTLSFDFFANYKMYAGYIYITPTLKYFFNYRHEPGKRAVIIRATLGYSIPLD